MLKRFILLIIITKSLNIFASEVQFEELPFENLMFNILDIRFEEKKDREEFINSLSESQKPDAHFVKHPNNLMGTLFLSQKFNLYQLSYFLWIHHVDIYKIKIFQTTQSTLIKIAKQLSQNSNDHFFNY